MGERDYVLYLNGKDQEALKVLRRRVPMHWSALADVRAAARAVVLLFPKVEVRLVSVEREGDPDPHDVRVI